MNPITVAALFAASATAAQLYPFILGDLDSHQPSGVADGQVDYYGISFNLTSDNGATPQNASCLQSWPDNDRSCTDCVPYSTDVPTGQWFECGNGFAFQLYPYFSIGNFSISLRQNYTDSSGYAVTAQSSVYHITNTTGELSCDIDPVEASSVGQHAQGDCYLASNVSAIDIPAVSSSSACSGATVSVSFPVLEKTSWGDSVFVTGNISQLGKWDLSDAVALNAAQYTSSDPLWTGTVGIAVGTPFEYKYVRLDASGTWVWECGNNRKFTVESKTCGAEAAGKNPDSFRCGSS